MINIEDLKEFKKKTAIVILAYAEYECLELALATHARFTVNSGVHIFILQNGCGTYDCERTYRTAQRYHNLYPEEIDVIDDISPDRPYYSIKKLLNSERFKQYEYIIKLDDDVLVLTENWVDKLCECYFENSKKYDDLAYVSSLVNNNPYGFKRIIENSDELSEEYFTRIARKHLVGLDEKDPYGPYRILEKDQIYSGKCGTIWKNPDICRWLHEKTSLVPEQYILFTRDLPQDEPENCERFSINCILFKKELWNEINYSSNDDEHLLHLYCMRKDKRIVVDLSIPMVHMFFFTQREECRDLLPRFIDVYTDFLGLDFPIQICANREIEIENRLRFHENKKNISNDQLSEDINNILKSPTYRIGCIFTFIPRKIRTIIKKLRKNENNNL